MWFNVGYWKDVKPTEYKGGVNPFVLACQEMTSLLTRVVDLNDGSFILGISFGETRYLILKIMQMWAVDVESKISSLQTILQNAKFLVLNYHHIKSNMQKQKQP